MALLTKVAALPWQKKVAKEGRGGEEVAAGTTREEGLGEEEEEEATIDRSIEKGEKEENDAGADLSMEEGKEQAGCVCCCRCGTGQVGC